jgi:hypothetical protein
VTVHLRIHDPKEAGAMQVNLNRRSGIALCGALAAALMLLVVPSALSQAGGGSTYTDKTGDNAAAADITGVTVSSDAPSGQVLFRISGTNLATNPNQDTEVLIDSDANPVTGDVGEFGADYWFGVADMGYGFEHFDGSTWVETPYTTVQVTGGGTSLLISVNKSELGNTADFNFRVDTWDKTTRSGDVAPDLGTYNYSIVAGGPLIQSVDVVTKPQLGPRAGKTFVLTPAGLHLPSDGSAVTVLPQPDSYSCAATLKSARLPGTGTGGCTFKLTKKARGKALTVVLTVVYEGATTSVPYHFRVG